MLNREERKTESSGSREGVTRYLFLVTSHLVQFSTRAGEGKSKGKIGLTGAAMPHSYLTREGA